MSAPPAGPRPYLEHSPEPGEAPHRIFLDPLPFIIGRSQDAHHTIFSRKVSREHAEISAGPDGLVLRDLGSTNGTFVNGLRVTEARLFPGDVIHVAHKAFTFGVDAWRREETDVRLARTLHDELEAQGLAARAGRHLEELLARQEAHVVYQPIVDLATRQVRGYEALGRGGHAELSSRPLDLFEIADQHGLASDLSRLFRLLAAAQASHLGRGTALFVNLHPAERLDAGLVGSLEELRERLRPDLPLVLEVHERAAADSGVMAWLREALHRLDIGLAYDDFGSGQARLMELVEVPPDYVKLDMALIRNVRRETPRHGLLQALSKVVTEMGVRLVAEGIETEAEAGICREIGCELGQGFLFGRPTRAPLAPPAP